MSHSHFEDPGISVTGQHEEPVMCTFIQRWPGLHSVDALLRQGVCVCAHHSLLFDFCATFAGTKLPQFSVVLLVDQYYEQILRFWGG